MSQTPTIPAEMISETRLVSQLIAEDALALELRMHRGSWTPLRFSQDKPELQTLLRSAGVFDLGFKTILRAAGRDRVRWLNGMITNTVKGMSPGQVAYTLVLNPQG